MLLHQKSETWYLAHLFVFYKHPKYPTDIKGVIIEYYSQCYLKT